MEQSNCSRTDGEMMVFSLSDAGITSSSKWEKDETGPLPQHHTQKSTPSGL